MKVQHSEFIRRPIAEVFDFVTDLRNETRWQPEIISVTLDGPLAEGSTFRERRVTFGRRFDWRFRVTRLEASGSRRRISIETITGACPYRGAREFTAVPGGTRVDERGELTLPAWLGALEPALAYMSRRPLQIAYARLRRMLEAQPERVALTRAAG